MSSIQIKKQETIYRPVININGFLMDHVPIFKEKSNGIICPCASRKNKIYFNAIQFRKHLQSKKHQQWMEILNLEKKIHQLEGELKQRYNESYQERDELWYTEMFPETKDSDRVHFSNEM